MRLPFTLVAGVLLATCMAASAQSGTTTTKTYRWVDEQGVVHFSDSPRPGSQDPTQDEYELNTPNVVRSRVPRISRRRGPTDDEKPQQETPFTGYRSLDIIAPGPGDTLWNIGGSLNVGVQTSPSLRAGDGIVVWIDGKQMTPQPVRSTSFTVNEVYRGQHVIMAAIRAADGTDMITSAAIQFVVQQSTVN